MGKVGNAALGIGLSAAGIASGAGWFSGAFWKQAGLMAATSFLGAKLNPVHGRSPADLGVQIAQEGADLPRGWGRWRQAGTLVWCPGLVEHRQGGALGKGAPASTEFGYTASAMILGGAGSVTRVERIRLNERVEYDYNNGQERPYHMVVQGDVASGAWKWVKSGDGKVRLYPGTINQPVDIWLESVFGVGQWTNYPGLRAAFFENCNLKNYGGRLPNATFDCYNAQTDLAAVCSEIALLRGYKTDDLDFYELEGVSIAPNDDEGYVLASRRAASAALDELGFLFSFSIREQNGVLQAIKRGRFPVAVLGGRELVVHSDGEATIALEERLADENDLVNVEEVTFSDAGRESNPGMRRAVRTDAREVALPGARGGRVAQSSVSARLRGGRALRAAQIRLHEKWAARESFPLAIPPRLLRLAGGDVISIDTPDGAREVVLPLLNQPFFGALTSASVAQDRLLYSLPIPTDGGDATSSPLPDTPETPIGFAVDCVALDSDSPDMVSKMFVLLAATQIEGRKWAGAECNVEKPTDPATQGADVTWKKDYDVTLRTRATMGYLRSAWTPGAVEEGETTNNPILAHLYAGELHSAAPGRAHNGVNILAFETGLVVSFRAATGPSSDPLDVDLSGLKCGIYGSDYAETGAGNRTAGGPRSLTQLPQNTKFLLFRDEEGDLGPGVFVTGFGVGTIGQDRRFTFTPHDVIEPYNHAMSFPVQPLRGRSFEPLSPLSVATRQSDGGVRFVGHARTRFVEDSTDNPTRSSERATPQGYRYRITLTSGSQSGTLTRLTGDALAAFDFTLSAGDIAGALGRAAADVASDALGAEIALWSDDGFGYGRKTVWNSANQVPANALLDENGDPLLDAEGQVLEGENN